MTRRQHIKRHKELHKYLDELAADFFTHTNNLPSSSSIMDLMKWSYSQTNDPTEEKSVKVKRNKK